MKVLIVILLAFFSTDPKEIAKANALKKEAEQAFLSGDYETAAEKYRFLIDSMEVNDDVIKLNLGHAYYHLGDSAAAKSNYGKVGSSKDNRLKSIAYQQLGVMSKEANKLKPALEQLKSSIKSDPSNTEAIYNYEVVKKLLAEQQKQEQDQNEEDKVEPSEYAKRMKARSDQERLEGNFTFAYNTMLEAYEKDQTVKAYEDYIAKLRKILFGKE